MTQPKKVLTLCLLRRDGRVALAKKLRGFGVGNWNGYGGRVEEGESVLEAAIREIYEETGNQVNVSPLDLNQVAVLNFHFSGDSEVREVHVFVADHWEGEPQESEEMGEPSWFAATDLPAIEAQMWPADRLWLPAVLNGRSIYGVFIYSADGSRVAEHQIINATY